MQQQQEPDEKQRAHRLLFKFEEQIMRCQSQYELSLQHSEMQPELFCSKSKQQRHSIIKQVLKSI